MSARRFHALRWKYERLRRMVVRVDPTTTFSLGRVIANTSLWRPRPCCRNSRARPRPSRGRTELAHALRTHRKNRRSSPRRRPTWRARDDGVAGIAHAQELLHRGVLRCARDTSDGVVEGRGVAVGVSGGGGRTVGVGSRGGRARVTKRLLLEDLALAANVEARVVRVRRRGLVAERREAHLRREEGRRGGPAGGTSAPRLGTRRSRKSRKNGGWIADASSARARTGDVSWNSGGTARRTPAPRVCCIVPRNARARM